MGKLIILVLGKEKQVNCRVCWSTSLAYTTWRISYNWEIMFPNNKNKAKWWGKYASNWKITPESVFDLHVHMYAHTHICKYTSTHVHMNLSTPPQEVKRNNKKINIYYLYARNWDNHSTYIILLNDNSDSEVNAYFSLIKWEGKF